MFRRLRKAILILLNVLTLFNFSYAEDISLEKIVVTPSRIEEEYSDTPRSVDIITSKEIESSGSSDISEVLSGITSVNITSYGGPGETKTIKMRGSTAAQTLVMVDGRPINSPRDGEADLSGIPLDNISRIEVMRGPASNLYGAASMGGTINIITKNPPKEKFKTEFMTSGGTRHTIAERFSHGGRLSGFGYLISGNYESSQGFRENSAFNERDFNSKLEYTLNDYNSIFVNCGFLKSNTGTPGQTSLPDLDDKQKSVKNFLDFNWEFKPDPTTGIKTHAYNNYDRLEFTENTAGSIFDLPFNKDIHTTNTTGYGLQINKKLFPHYQFITGFDYIKNANDSTTSAKHKYTVRAGFLENEFTCFDKLTLNLSVRVDNYSNFGLQPSPSLNVMYKLNENTKLRSLISRSFRAPTFNDLYWPDQGWVKGNPNLKPEKGTTAEIGVESRLNKYLDSSLTYYHSAYSELINWMEAVPFVWSPVNVGSVTIDGLEFENKFFLTDALEFDSGYSFLVAKDDKTGKFLIYQPEYKVDCSLKYKNYKGFAFELKGQFVNTRFHNPENSVKVKRFFVFGLNISKKFKNGITYFFSVDNLFNRNYQVVKDFPMPGFSLNNGLKISF